MVLNSNSKYKKGIMLAKQFSNDLNVIRLLICRMAMVFETVFIKSILILLNIEKNKSISKKNVSFN